MFLFLLLSDIKSFFILNTFSPSFFFFSSKENYRVFSNGTKSWSFFFLNLSFVGLITSKHELRRLKKIMSGFFTGNREPGPGFDEFAKYLLNLIVAICLVCDLSIKNGRYIVLSGLFHFEQKHRKKRKKT